IQPILEKSCWRCHGPERPKSHFRLDNRESALKGGENGLDIIPGNSAKSPLIHFVARLVPDMEMPPPGKGPPLTPDQIGLLRAWIASEKSEVRFVPACFEHWLRYYDDTGVYYRPYAIPSFDLTRDLHLDIGRAWIDCGLNLPRWPLIVLGYEYQFKEGAKSMLE